MQYLKLIVLLLLVLLLELTRHVLESEFLDALPARELVGAEHRVNRTVLALCNVHLKGRNRLEGEVVIEEHDARAETHHVKVILVKRSVQVRALPLVKEHLGSCVKNALKPCRLAPLVIGCPYTAPLKGLVGKHGPKGGRALIGRLLCLVREQ